MKKIFSILIVSIMLLGLFPLQAEAAKNTYNVGVHDLAEVLSPTEEAELQKIGEKYSKKLKIDIVFLTAKDTNGKSSTPYADDFYDGIEGPITYGEDGIILFIDLDNNANTVSTAGKAIKNINDYEVDKILDAAEKIPLDNYYDCLKTMADTAAKVYKLHNYADFALFGVFQMSFVTIIIGVVATVIYGITLVATHFAANKKTSATTYLKSNTKDNSIKVINRRERFIKSTDRVSRGYYKSNSSSGGGRSSGSSHRSSSGRSHGGGSRSR